MTVHLLVSQSNKVIQAYHSGVQFIETWPPDLVCAFQTNADICARSQIIFGVF